MKSYILLAAILARRAFSIPEDEPPSWHDLLEIGDLMREAANLLRQQGDRLRIYEEPPMRQLTYCPACGEEMSTVP